MTRRVYFIPSHSTDTAVDVAVTFFKNVFSQHGLPENILSDRDPKFLSKFSKHLMKLCDIQLEMSSSRHAQTDGAFVVMNRMIENYLRCYCSYHQNDWDDLLPAAKFAYNSAVSEDLGMSSIELDLGWNPKSALEFLTKPESPVKGADDFKSVLKESLEDAKFPYGVSKAIQRAYSTGKFKPPNYKVGDRLWNNKSLFFDAYSKSQQSKKLTAKRFGPFCGHRELVGKNAVRLKLPDHFRNHPVVHVIHITLFFEQPSEIAALLPGRPELVPAIDGNEYIVEEILAHRKKGRGYQFLTIWKRYPSHDASWQPTTDFAYRDGSLNDAWHKYIKKEGLLPTYY